MDAFAISIATAACSLTYLKARGVFFLEHLAAITKQALESSFIAAVIFHVDTVEHLVYTTTVTIVFFLNTLLCQCLWL